MTMGGSGRSPMLPWATGLGVLLLLAAGTAVATWRIDPADLGIPREVLEYQQLLTAGAAQAMRASLNEGVDDLLQAAGRPAATDVSPEGVEEALRAVADVHGRYEALYVVDESGSVVAAVGGEPRPDVVAGAIEAPGMADALPSDPGAIAPQYAPYGRGAIVGHYDLDFLRFAAETVAPGESWVVDDRGDVLWSSTASPRFRQLDREELREAVRRARNGGAGSLRAGERYGDQLAVGYAAISGHGPAGDLGWALVTARSATSMPSPVADGRRVGFTVALTLAVVTLAIFGWLYAAGVAPLRRRGRRSSGVG